MIDFKSGRKLLALLSDLFLRTGKNPSQIPQLPQKTESFYGVFTERYFPRATPEECGIPSEAVESFLHELEHDPLTHVHTVMLLCDGRVISDASAGSYRSDRVHLSHSMCKSLVGLAYGFLTDEGRISLDDKIADFFPEYKKELGSKMKSVTVRDLLTMGVAISFNEKDALLTENWTLGYLQESLKEASGSVFSYNSMSSFMLSSILQRVTGETLFSYLESHLFAPLHIRHVFWEENPEGVTKGGWGLYISPEDMAKLGMLLLDCGMFEGKRLISEGYMREMTSVQNRHPDPKRSYDYGFHIWIGREKSNILFNGMLGQNILIIPQNRMIVVFTAGNQEIFQNSSMLRTAERYFTDRERTAPLPKNKKAERSLLLAQAHFFENRAFHKALTEVSGVRRLFSILFRKTLRPLPFDAYMLDGVRFDMEPSNYGILPLMVATTQNSFSPGMREISFSVEGNAFFMQIDEGDESYKLRVGLYAPAENDITVRGERYILALSGYFTQNEDDVPILKLTFSFPELPCEKHVKLYYAGPDITLVSSELPGYAVVEPFIQKLEDNKSGLLSLLMTLLPYKVLKDNLRLGFSPILHGKRQDGGLLPAPNLSVTQAEISVPDTENEAEIG